MWLGKYTLHQLILISQDRTKPVGKMAVSTTSDLRALLEKKDIYTME